MIVTKELLAEWKRNPESKEASIGRHMAALDRWCGPEMERIMDHWESKAFRDAYKYKWDVCDPMADEYDGDDDEQKETLKDLIAKFNNTYKRCCYCGNKIHLKERFWYTDAGDCYCSSNCAIEDCGGNIDPDEIGDAILLPDCFDDFEHDEN